MTAVPELKMLCGAAHKICHHSSIVQMCEKSTPTKGICLMFYVLPMTFLVLIKRPTMQEARISLRTETEPTLLP